MPHSNRVTQDELEHRYDIVKSCIDRGLTGAETWRYIERYTDWGISRQQAYNYYNECKKQFIDEATQIDRAEEFTKSLRRLEYIYKQSLLKEDYRLAKDTTMDVVKLLKLDAPDANFDWKKKAKAAGIDDDAIFERLDRLQLETETESQKEAQS